MKRRILLITPSLTLPSDSSQLRLLIAGLTEQKFDVHVVSVSDAIGSSFDIDQATVYPLGLGQPYIHRRAPHHAITLARTIKRLIGTLQPNIVHAWDANARLELAWACQNYPNVKTCETISSLNMPRSHIRQMIRNRLAPHANLVSVPHQCVAEHLIKAGYPADRIKVIAPAVAVDPTANRATAKRNLTDHLGLPDSIYLAGTIAPLEPRFRLKDLIWATDLLTCIRDDFHLVIVGRGKQKTRLEKFASQTEAGSHVHFIDSQPENLTASDLYLGTDVYWNANLNLPLASPLLHAMAGGTPVISVLGNGTSELIHHQETGFAVNFGARDEFARWTKYLIEQTTAASQLSHQGRTFGLTNYPVDSMVQAFVEQYEAAPAGSSVPVLG